MIVKIVIIVRDRVAHGDKSMLHHGSTVRLLRTCLLFLQNHVPESSSSFRKPY